MSKIITAVLILFAVYAVYLTAEAIRAKKDRKKLTHVIYVNGTRGKSTVTRMIDAGLRAAGYKTFSKSTGTLPMCIHTDGSETEIIRKAPANIREQLDILHLAAEEGAEILVIECMALDPRLQEVSSRRMLGADIGVITNARLDHMDVMGQTRPEILSCLMKMLPVRGRIFTAEADLFSLIEEEAKKLESPAFLALSDDIPETEDYDFKENISLAFAVCKAIAGEKVSDETILGGIRGFKRDPYALGVYRQGKLTFVNALSANDVDSTKIIYEQQRGGPDEKLTLLINNRGDRPARARDMARLCGELAPDEIWLLGEQQKALAGLIRKKAPSASLSFFEKAEDIPLDFEKNSLIMAVGNIKNEGILLSERVRQEMTEINTHRKEEE